MTTNDNHITPRESAPLKPDAHGHASLLLVESLIHGLRERSVLSHGDAIDIVGTAIEVQAEVADAADGDGMAMQKAHALLSAIAESLRMGADGSDGDGR